MPDELLLPAHTEATPTARPYNTENTTTSSWRSLQPPLPRQTPLVPLYFLFMDVLFAIHSSNVDEVYIPRNHIS